MSGVAALCHQIYNVNLLLRPPPPPPPPPVQLEYSKTLIKHG